MNLKRSTPRHTVIKMEKVKDKEKISKAARVKQLVKQKENTPIRLSADLPGAICTPEGVAGCIESAERKKPCNLE